MEVFKATLSNPLRADAPPVHISFPIREYDYDEVYWKLAAIGAGDAVARDCRVSGIEGSFYALAALDGQDVNVDELDYLAKRLDSFCESEARQYEGVAAAKSITDIEGLINLTFSCTQATVIADFSDLKAIGQEHYLNTHVGCAPISVLEALDAVSVASELIKATPAAVTPHGVVYDNGMKLERLYSGKAFPAYIYDHCILTLELTKASAPDETAAFLELPMPDVCLKRALERGGFSGSEEMTLHLCVLGVSSDVFKWIDPMDETPEGLNEAARAIDALDEDDLTKFCAATEYIEPCNAAQIHELAQRIDMFEFYKGVSTAEEYGRHVITQSGYFKYDAELHEFYDFERYGEWRLAHEQGEFLDGGGYVCYNGDALLEDLFPQTAKPQGQGMTMGGT